jgi:FixJ family two-component response regulator
LQQDVYIVDSDASVAQSIAFLLEAESISARIFSSGQMLLETAIDDTPACVITESQLPDMSALRLLRQFQLHGIDAPVIVLSSSVTGDIPSAVDAVKGGAWDYLEKPFMQRQLMRSVRSAMEKSLVPA